MVCHLFFLRVKVIAHVDIDTLWLRLFDPKRFSTTAKPALSMLSAQGMLASLDRINSRAENVISGYCTSLDDVSMKASFYTQSFGKLIAYIEKSITK